MVINDLLEFVRKSIIEEKLSPKQIIDKIKAGKTSFSPNSLKSCNTIYSAIDKGIIPGVTRKTLYNNHKITMFGDGQIIIPKWVRESLSLKLGTKFDIKIGENEQMIITKCLEQDNKK